MAQPVRRRRYDEIESTFVGIALAHIVASRRQMGIDEESIVQSGVSFLDVYTTQEGRRHVSRNAAYPESVLPSYHVKDFMQLNHIDLKEPGMRVVYGWVFLRHGDNQLRKLKIEIFYQVMNKDYHYIKDYSVIEDSDRIGEFKPQRHPELAEIEQEEGL